MPRPVVVSVLGAAVLSTSAAASWAQQPNGAGGSGRCECACSAPNVSSVRTYDSQGLSCGAFNGKTCNIQNPNTGVIETGTLVGCITSSGQGEWALRSSAVLDPGGGITPPRHGEGVPKGQILDPGDQGGSQQQLQAIPSLRRAPAAQ